MYLPYRFGLPHTENKEHMLVNAAIFPTMAAQTKALKSAIAGDFGVIGRVF